MGYSFQNILIDIPLPYELSIKKAEAVLKEIVTKVEKNPAITSTQILGLTTLGESALIYKIKLASTPEQKGQARRDALKTIVETLEAHKISIPYNQLDVHQK